MPGLTHKGCVLQRISFGVLSDITVVFETVLCIRLKNFSRGDSRLIIHLHFIELFSTDSYKQEILQFISHMQTPEYRQHVIKQIEDEKVGCNYVEIQVCFVLFLNENVGLSLECRKREKVNEKIGSVTALLEKVKQEYSFI